MVRINPGSNVHGDNKTKTAIHGMTNVDIPEPIMRENGKFECPKCGRIFDSRAKYDSHAMAHHQINPEAIIERRQMQPMETEEEAEAEAQPPVAVNTATAEATMTCESDKDKTTCTTT